MIAADAFLEPARAQGFGFYTGVPCSFLTPLINRVVGGAAGGYVAAASEGEAVAIAAGAWLAGRGAVVMCQNSGLGNAVNPLTSLAYPFRIPILLIVAWRGGPGLKDEPQHELMGTITPQLLDVIKVAHGAFPSSDDAVAPALARARAAMAETQLPYALIMEKGAVRDDGLGATPPPPPRHGRRIELRHAAPPVTRGDVLERLVANLPAAAAVVATTGFTGRELFTVADRPQHLYQVGSMGCAASMGLGVALHSPRPVVVVDGDGALLMKMGTLATVGACAPKNFVHLVLDNGAYESTGGQPTTAPGVDFAQAAIACGYARAYACDELGGFDRALGAALAEPGPHLIHMRIASGTMKNLGRPTVTPAEVARRFQAFLAQPA